MKIELSNTEKEQLERQHRTERDRRVADRIKAVLLRSEGWTQKQIAQALRIRYETVQDHLDDFQKLRKLKPQNGGSKSQLSEAQSAELIEHLEAETYHTAALICAYVHETFGVKYTPSGMTKWLVTHGFSYKKPKGVPAKADSEAQAQWIKSYEALLNTAPEDEPIEFGDGLHPSMSTKLSYGWIRKGVDKDVQTTGNRARMNLMGSINLESMEVTIGNYETINSDAMKAHFSALRTKYPKAPKIHLILDQGRYNTSLETRKAAKKYGIVLKFLPPYSPNLNPIERLWKIMNEHVRNNRFFRTAKEFRESIMGFFQKTWPKIALEMTDRVNDNFQTLNKASSG